MSFADILLVLQGLSHYLEHMLFMGSKKYPDENEYDSFLTKHGGASNAFTELVRLAITTVYCWQQFFRQLRTRCMLDMIHAYIHQSCVNPMSRKQQEPMSPGKCSMQEFTNYHFDVKPNALHGALDRFAQFFIDPLCKADALEREVMAVDNEFSGKQKITHHNLQQQQHAYG